MIKNKLTSHQYNLLNSYCVKQEKLRRLLNYGDRIPKVVIENQKKEVEKLFKLILENGIDEKFIFSFVHDGEESLKRALDEINTENKRCCVYRVRREQKILKKTGSSQKALDESYNCNIYKDCSVFCPKFKKMTTRQEKLYFNGLNINNGKEIV